MRNSKVRISSHHKKEIVLNSTIIMSRNNCTLQMVRHFQISIEKYYAYVVPDQCVNHFGVSLLCNVGTRCCPLGVIDS